MKRNKFLSGLAILLLASGVATFYLGFRYEMNQFSPEAQVVLNQTGETFFIVLRWMVLGFILLGLGIIAGSFALANWINWMQTDR
jgi:multisubunit Na+/H+ antiporter MnhB subunit